LSQKKFPKGQEQDLLNQCINKFLVKEEIWNHLALKVAKIPKNYFVRNLNCLQEITCSSQMTANTCGERIDEYGGIKEMNKARQFNTQKIIIET